MNSSLAWWKRCAEGFSRSIISTLEEEVDVIDRFYEHREFEPERLDKEGILNPKIAEHPSILWAMKKL